MLASLKIGKLRKIISDNLLPIVINDYCLLDLPYYTNIGDVLIWEGTEAFLKTLSHQCLYQASIDTYRARRIAPTTQILLQGGGNFGDLWRKHQDFRLRIIQEYPENTIIILPQSVWYENNCNAITDAAVMARHRNLYICARDRKSYEFLKKHFNNEILLIPDMAFYLPHNHIQKQQILKPQKSLFLKRCDKEINSHIDYIKHLRSDNPIDTHDWPTMEKTFFPMCILSRLISQNNMPIALADTFAKHLFKPTMIRAGIDFMSRYKSIYTTRLHGALLAFLLDKQVTWFDNSYRKNSSFFDTWFTDADGIVLVRQ